MPLARAVHEANEFSVGRRAPRARVDDRHVAGQLFRRVPPYGLAVRDERVGDPQLLGDVAACNTG